MITITRKINELLNEKDLSRYRISKLLNKNEGYINHVFNGDQTFSANVLKQLLPILGVSKEEFESWVLADKYSKDVLTRAIQAKKAFPFKRKSILTTRLDEILKTKGISRTNLAKQINYSQSGLNRMIIGQINMSKPVMEKVASVLGISQDEILSWSVADKYSVALLESALNE